jgi:ubiquinone/menaquinone biosynthesis C-methylase UbiE
MGFDKRGGMRIDKMQKYIIDGYQGRYDVPEIREFYDQSEFMNFGYWDEHTKNQKKACQNLMDQLLSLIRNKNGTILDVACSRGETTSYLLKYYLPENVSGIDISEAQLNMARRKAAGCSFAVMSATELRFPDNSFDNILCVEAPFHFYTRERFFREAHRVLKPGGSLVLSDVLMTLEAERIREDRTEKNYVKDLEQYRALLQSAGFTDVIVIDATEQCWKGHFWHVVTCFHRKFLRREIMQDQLQAYLTRTYRRVSDITYYPLAAGRKV